jgi:hypothetical protein
MLSAFDVIAGSMKKRKSEIMTTVVSGVFALASTANK